MAKCKHDLVEVTAGFISATQRAIGHNAPLLKCKKCLSYYYWEDKEIEKVEVSE